MQHTSLASRSAMDLTWRHLSRYLVCTTPKASRHLYATVLSIAMLPKCHVSM